ncbi:toxin co-regulated pilus biosynthesis Q family protein [Acidithiobacillus sp. MC6.1]|nr:toxin co-regulated pilus biosynthesis Q family protein [Acidithiobacillus sp. MC6.1]
MSPHLEGFHKSFFVQPTLAIHGNGIPGKPDRMQSGIHSLREVLQEALPTGWSLYTKPGVVLDIPVQITSHLHSEMWIKVLHDLLQKSGLHGAVWWNQQVVTLWTAPVTPHPVEASKPLDLKGFLKTHMGGLPISTQSAAYSHDTALPLPTPSLAGLTPVFLLNRGDLILTDLQKWAKQSGWTVVWQVPEDWQVPNTTSFSGDFQKAVGQVIQALSANGANVHAVFHTANNTVVISGAGGGE